jgi:hypothetical protein
MYEHSTLLTSFPLFVCNLDSKLSYPLIIPNVHGLWDMEDMLDIWICQEIFKYSCDVVVYLDFSKNILFVSKCCVKEYFCDVDGI